MGLGGSEQIHLVIQHEDYIITGGESEKLDVYDIRKQQIVQSLKLEKTIWCGAIVKNNILYVGCGFGHLYEF